MKLHKYILLSILLGVAISVFSQNDCRKGDQNPPFNDTPDAPSSIGDGADVSAGLAIDPNEIIGPSGYDSSHWVSLNDILTYTILFENDAEFATAWAQQIGIRFSFASQAAMRGFELGDYGFANHSWSVPSNLNAYQSRMDLRDSMHVYVDLTAGIDATNLQAYWHFYSIDSETGLAPWQIDRGMLPVNDSTHVGEGFVTFRLKPDPSLHTGDTISIVASICFDQNDTVETNRWTNRIDAIAPTSTVIASKKENTEDTYLLSFTATDDRGGCGVKRVRLYLANNFGIYEEYAVCSPDSILEFQTEFGQQYAFISLAEDHVGNIEDHKESPDCVINNNEAPTDIILSDTIFNDDIALNGFIGELSAVDTETNSKFTFAMAEGQGALHNDLFRIAGTQLQSNSVFRCADDTVYHVRIGVTDEGGLTFSKPFVLHLRHVLSAPAIDTITANVCQGESFLFQGVSYSSAGDYTIRKENENQCDSIYLVQLSVWPKVAAPIVSVEGTHTLVSSAAQDNQWYYADGTSVPGATEQRFTPTEDGLYYVVCNASTCPSYPSNVYQVSISGVDTLRWNLIKGWNWVSSFLIDPAYTTTSGLLSSFSTSISQMSSEDIAWEQQSLMSRAVSPLSAYKIKVNTSVDKEWVGQSASPETNTISLHAGWNWIGYLPIIKLELGSAISSPSEGDIIKDYYDFAVFSAGQWHGTLTNLEPGVGYMYFSTKNSVLQYPSSRAFDVSLTDSDPVRIKNLSGYYSPCFGNYPQSMSIIADVVYDGCIAPAGQFSIGAFVDNECRGTGIYSEGKLFMTIYGSEDLTEAIRFVAHDNLTGTDYPITQTVLFNDSVLGTIAAPYQLEIFESTTALTNVHTNGLTIYPNPVRETLYVVTDLSNADDIVIISALGQVVTTFSEYKGGLNVKSLPSGVYILGVRSKQQFFIESFIKY